MKMGCKLFMVHTVNLVFIHRVIHILALVFSRTLVHITYLGYSNRLIHGPLTYTPLDGFRLHISRHGLECLIIILDFLH